MKIKIEGSKSEKVAIPVKIYSDNWQMFYSYFWVYEIIDERKFYEKIKFYWWFTEKCKNNLLSMRLIKKISN